MITKKVFFLGEYGFAFRQLLPFLEKNNDSFELITWGSICELIDLLWPKKYQLIKAESIMEIINPEYRNSNGYGDENLVRGMGYKHVSELSEMFTGNIKEHNDLIKTKVVYGLQNSDKPYVSIFSRKRKHRNEKNIFNCKHFDWIKQNYPNHEIIGHGLKGERGEFNVKYCDNILEQINYFNNSLFFLSDDSGIIDLALMSGCDLVLTTDIFNGEMDYKRYLKRTNYHNCKITYFDDVYKGD